MNRTSQDRRSELKSPLSMTNEDRNCISGSDGVASQEVSVYGSSGTSSAFTSQSFTVRLSSEVSSWVPSGVDEIDGNTFSKMPSTIERKSTAGSPSRMVKEASPRDGREYHSTSFGVFYRTPPAVDELNQDEAASATSELFPVADDMNTSSPQRQCLEIPARLSPVTTDKTDKSSPSGTPSPAASKLHTENVNDNFSTGLSPGTPRRTPPETFMNRSVSEASLGTQSMMGRLKSSSLSSSDVSGRSSQMGVLPIEAAVENVSPERPLSTQMNFDCE